MENIEILGRREHAKASEVYVDVVFKYESQSFLWSIPIEYRRTGVNLGDATQLDIDEYIKEVYELCDPKHWKAFLDLQEIFWSEMPNSQITKEFYDVLASDFTWKSNRFDLPQNPNSQRRIQQLKELGYTIATASKIHPSEGNRASTHHLLLPLPRGGVTGYETWSPEMRNRIVMVLGGVDAYECGNVNKYSLLPDHKFPEIRWDDNVRRTSLENLSDDDIRRDFQLISNQRNQQKREVCRSCFQTGKRGTIFGINFFSSGSIDWPAGVPVRGKEAEIGCVGCPWYDIEEWRLNLNEKTSD